MKKKEALFAVIGGVVGAVLVMAAGSFAPLGAQNEVADAEFGTITCSKLVVRYDGFSFATEINPTSVTVSEDDGRSVELSANGVSVVGTGEKRMVQLSFTEDGGSVRVFGKDGGGAAGMNTDEDGGIVTVYGKDGGGAAQMAITENGGAIHVHGKDGGGAAGMNTDEDGGIVTVLGKDGERSAQMAITENGGLVTLTGKENGKDGREGVQMAITENGGAVRVYGNDGERSAQMAINEDGGAVRVYGKGNTGSRAGMGVDEYGNGAVSTWDKNGYRLATLK